MSKTDLRERVFDAADGLFLRSGSLHGFGYREVRKLAKGASNDVLRFFNEWKASREQMRQSRPAALAAVADEFAGTLWLMAQLLLSAGRGAGPATNQPDVPKIEPSDDVQEPRSAATRGQPVSDGAKPSRNVAETPATGFSSIPRPGPVVKPPARRRRAKKAVLVGKAARPFVLGPPRPVFKGAELSDSDWKGAQDLRMAEAVAKALRKHGTRMQAFAIYNALPPSNRPSSKKHAARDLEKALAGSKIKWSKGGWFWFEDEPLPKETGPRRKTDVAKSYRRGDELWWRIAHSIARLGRPFTSDEIANATVKEREGFAESWLRVRLIRATKGDHPFLQEREAGILEWTGLDPSHVVKDS